MATEEGHTGQATKRVRARGGEVPERRMRRTRIERGATAIFAPKNAIGACLRAAKRARLAPV